MSKVTGSLKHTHRYCQSVNKRGNITWKCMLDGCTHFLPSNMGEPFGMKSICWKCENAFIMDYAHLKQEKPWCNTCGPQSELIAITDKLMDMFMPDRDMDPIQRKMKESSERAIQKARKQIEEHEETVVHEAKEEHMSDCATSLGMECDCK